MIERIPKEKWSSLDFRRYGGRLPKSGDIHGYMENGRIVGWYLTETVKHVGPFEVLADYQHNGIGTTLAAHAKQQLEGVCYYVAALNPHSEYLCRKFGMVQIDGSLWVSEADVA